MSSDPIKEKSDSIWGAMEYWPGYTSMQLKGQIHDTLAAAYDIDATACDIDHVNDAMDC